MENFSAFLLFAFVATFTPGPNNIMLMTSSLNFGIKRTLPHFAGVLFGFQGFLLVIGFGLGAVFLRYPLFHSVIKIVGALYMLYLAFKIATAHTKISDKDTEKKPLNFFQAVLFQWANPKAWSIGAGSIAAYTSVQGNIYLEVFIIVATYFSIFLPCGLMWMAFGKGLKRLLKNDDHQRYFNYTMGAILALSVALIFVE